MFTLVIRTMTVRIANEIKVFELIARNNNIFNVGIDNGCLKIEDTRTKNIVEVDPLTIKEFKYLAPNTVMIKKDNGKHITIGLLTGYLYISC